MILSDAYEFEQIDDEGILVDLKGGRFIRTNELATCIISLVLDGMKLEDIVQYIVGKYEVSYERALCDIKEFIKRMYSAPLCQDKFFSSFKLDDLPSF